MSAARRQAFAWVADAIDFYAPTTGHAATVDVVREGLRIRDALRAASEVEDAAWTPSPAATIAPGTTFATETGAAPAEPAPDAPVPGGCSLTLLDKGSP